MSAASPPEIVESLSPRAGLLEKRRLETPGFLASMVQSNDHNWPRLLRSVLPSLWIDALASSPPVVLAPMDRPAKKVTLIVTLSSVEIGSHDHGSRTVAFALAVS